MLERLLPTVIDARQRTNSAAFFVLLPVAALKLVMGFNAIVMTRYIAAGADGIPLDTYGAAAAKTVLAFFALWGLGQALLALFGLVAAFRYRQLMPLAFLLLSVEHFGRKALFALHPISRVTAERSLVGPVLDWSLIIALLVGLALSLGPDRSATA